METIEKKEKERELIAKLFSKLTQEKVLQKQHFESG
jgi:hypothetical protein